MRLNDFANGNQKLIFSICVRSKPAMLYLWGKKAEGDLSRPFKTGGGLMDSLSKSASSWLRCQEGLELRIILFRSWWRWWCPDRRGIHQGSRKARYQEGPLNLGFRCLRKSPVVAILAEEVGVAQDLPHPKNISDAFGCMHYCNRSTRYSR